MSQAQALRYIEHYFDAIDQEISVRLLRRVPPLETTLTDELLALMDGTTRDREQVDRPAHTLREQLRRIRKEGSRRYAFPGGLLKTEIKTVDHGGAFEGHVSHADVGLIINVHNVAGDDTPRSAAYVLQAKKLFAHKYCEHGSLYRTSSSFSSISKTQQIDASKVMHHIGAGRFLYMYYMPRKNYLECNENTQRFILRSSFRKLLYEREKTNGGIWIARTEDGSAFRTPDQIFARSDDATSTFTDFILAHFRTTLGVPSYYAKHGLLTPSWSLVGDSYESDLAIGIAQGDQSAANELMALMKVKSKEFKILPATTMTLTIPGPFPRPTLKPLSILDDDSENIAPAPSAF